VEKHFKRWYRGKLRQTMVDSLYCLDRVIPEGRSHVSRRSEVGNHNRRTLNLAPGCLLAHLRELSHVLGGLKEIIGSKQVRKTKRTGILYQIQIEGEGSRS